ncbi:S-adenosyl-L-methionine-dependent methyltransferase [Wilcoxina mikolae CBS 423.85]|nr:S-adenosyl-L-methionine-dependent methyltransferase [Wilcoxina mikolae CBS 423.85]
MIVLSGVSSETFSVSSSIYDYRYENGRTYHRYRDGAYMLPNDEELIDQDRLDLVHHMYLIILEGRLTLAPIENPKRVLDVGTGTGLWVCDLGDSLPADCQIIGTDLSPIQPDWYDQNVQFEIDDAESDWLFPENHFDFIHSRHLQQSIRNWPAYLGRIYRHLAPGGWVELSEHSMQCDSDDGTLPSNCPLVVYIEKLRVCSAKAGFMSSRNPGARLKQLAKDAGFVDIQHTVMKVPWGPWPDDERMKEIGRWNILSIETGCEAFGMALLTRIGGMPPEEAKQLCSDALKDVKDKRIHMFNYHHFVIARKPKPGEVIKE